MQIKISSEAVTFFFFLSAGNYEKGATVGSGPTLISEIYISSWSCWIYVYAICLEKCENFFLKNKNVILCTPAQNGFV